MKIIKDLNNKRVGAFSYLVKPDTEYNKKGEYKCNLYLNEEEIIDLQKTCDTIITERITKEEGKNPRNLGKITSNDYIHLEYNKEGKETGKSFIKVKSQFKQEIYNNKGKIEEFSDVYMGSIVNMKVEVRDYYIAAQKKCGVTFLINGTQVVELIENQEQYNEKYFNDKKVEKEEKSSEGGMFGSLVPDEESGSSSF